MVIGLALSPTAQKIAGAWIIRWSNSFPEWAMTERAIAGIESAIAALPVGYLNRLLRADRGVLYVGQTPIWDMYR